MGAICRNYDGARQNAVRRLRIEAVGVMRCVETKGKTQGGRCERERSDVCRNADGERDAKEKNSVVPLVLWGERSR